SALGHAGQFGDGGSGGTEAHVAGDLVRFADASPGQQPVTPVASTDRTDVDHRPVVRPRPPAVRTGDPDPSDGTSVFWRDHVIGGNREHMGNVLGLQPYPQSGIVTV